MKKSPLPAEFVAFLRDIVLGSPTKNIRRIHRGMIVRWCLWRDDITANAIPGYATCPPEDPRTGFPAGWTYRNFSDIAREAIGTDAISTARRRAAALSA